MPLDETRRVARRHRVLLPLPLSGAYDYRGDVTAAFQPGHFVRVPLGRRHLIGVVWDDAPSDDTALPEERLKDIGGRIDVPPMSAEMRRFIDWVAAYTLSPAGAVLRLAMSVPAALEPLRAQMAYRLAAEAPAADTETKKLTDSRRRVLRELADGPPLSTADLARAAGVGTSVVRGVAELGWIESVEIAPSLMRQPDAARAGPTLSADQAMASETLTKRLTEGFSVTVLDGVTGSGKTEVYLEAIAANLRDGRQSLVLLPEIALSAQWLARFESRFGAPPAIWHSEIGEAQRKRTWRDIAENKVKVVVGARSALFLPYASLGIIVVDEEHESAFKQEEGVIYHARDMAVVRARFGKVPVVLVSATPSLETIINVERGRYDVLHLPDRHGGATLPEIRTIDLRREPPPRNSFLSATLRTALKETLEKGEQAMLFLNRRGYAPLTLCRTCGHRLECPSCTAWLVEHRRTGQLLCHHCGHTQAQPEACPSCGDHGSFVPCGPGVERVAEEAAALFPDARVLLVTSDTLVGPKDAQSFVDRVAGHDVDLIIGTQIVAKGHHFPLLTLVGVVDADLGLGGGDLRAAERTYQLLHQVAGRAGRGALAGRALLQTYMPEHPVMKALATLSHGKDARDRFLAAEAEERRRHHWPPFGRLAALIVSGPDERAVDGVARQLGLKGPHGEGVEVLGPAPAPLSRLRGNYRRRLLLKATRDIDLQGTLTDWLKAVAPPGKVRVKVDIDPYSFL